MNNKLSLKIAIAHVCTFAVTSSFAYLPDNLNNHQRWYSELSATFMKPSNIDYDEILAGRENTAVLVKTNYQTGLNVLLGYFLTQQDDVSVNYAYNNFKNSHSSSSNDVAEDASPFNTLETTNYSVNYNAIDLSIGHMINKQQWNVHFTGSLDYTRIKRSPNRFGRTADTSAFDGGSPATLFFQQEFSTFDGIGPQLGIDLGFKLKDHFSLVGGASLAVLMSELEIKGYPKSESLSANFDMPRIHSVALKTQAKIGLAYATTLKNSYPLSVELGYKGTFIQNQISEPTSIGNAFSMRGPYLGVGISG